MTTEAGGRRLILASQSESRQAMLRAAGVGFETIVSGVDEGAVRRTLEAGGVQPSPEIVARALATAKAEAVSRAHPEALVIGSDQVLALGKRLFEKPADMAAARRQLMELRGRMHDLVSAVALAERGRMIWDHAETATLTMRLFSPAFLDSYLAGAGEAVCRSVGAYQLEGLGAQLFERI
jgi:septum formation protein